MASEIGQAPHAQGVGEGRRSAVDAGLVDESGEQHPGNIRARGKGPPTGRFRMIPGSIRGR